ncbi:MAG: hypothetical protein C7B46_01155 [Sulfobacillus benefaciens]|uniref:Nucleotidyltransferase family protein n=1 Tax=Sulfobacillus benefaciens TaxID=453960 RepID=A0A2T2XLC7_9FIRM|nr:MAG: hypothetical protein C7B46_01155 [Sulfobacillus benefaciens]
MARPAGGSLRLTHAQIKALHQIRHALSESNVVWAITGSTAFAIRGLDTVAHDIDLQTDATGAYTIQRLLAPYMVWPVRYRISPKVRSHFGRAIIVGVIVEIMGSIEKRRADGAWASAPNLSALIEWISWDGNTWPVLALDYEASAYHALGRHDVANRLESWITDHA